MHLITALWAPARLCQAQAPHYTPVLFDSHFPWAPHLGTFFFYNLQFIQRLVWAHLKRRSHFLQLAVMIKLLSTRCCEIGPLIRASIYTHTEPLFLSSSSSVNLSFISLSLFLLVFPERWIGEVCSHSH